MKNASSSDGAGLGGPARPILAIWLFCFRGIPMLRAIQPLAVRLDCVEEQNELGAIAAGVRNYRNPVARFIGHPIPSPTDHEADARSFDIPRSDRGRVRRVTPNRDDDVAVRVLPPILRHEASIRHIFGHIEHRSRMMSESRTSCA